MTAKRILGLATMILIGALAVPVLAQDAGRPGGGGPGGGGGGFSGPGGGGPGGGGFGGRGNFDPAQFMQMRLQNIQQQLGSSDDEFAVLSPKIQKVMTAQQAANAGGGRGGFGRGGFGGGGPGGGGPGGPGGGGFGGGPGGPPNNGQPLTPVQQARQEVMTLLQDPNAPADQIKAKLDAYRDAVTKANEELAAAQADLKALLTQRQEAVLVMSNILK